MRNSDWYYDPPEDMYDDQPDEVDDDPFDEPDCPEDFWEIDKDVDDDTWEDYLADRRLMGLDGEPPQKPEY